MTLLPIPELQRRSLIETVRLNLLTTNVPWHIETTQVLCSADQLTGFYMIGNIGR